MSLRATSVAAFVLMVAGIVMLFYGRYLFARHLPGQIVQVLAASLMVWARIVFGRRSFHAAADPTEGGLVTAGPYRWIRHPIYAAAIYFAWAAALDARASRAVLAAALLTVGAALRIAAEEKLLIARYRDYPAYARRTARVVPFLL